MASEKAKKDYAEKIGLHPIAVEASTLVQTRTNGNVYFDDDAQYKLRVKLDALSRSEELRDAIDSLVQVAAHLEANLGQRQAARQLIDVAESCSRSLQEQNVERAQRSVEMSTVALSRIARFKGDAVGHRAPQFGAVRPNNCVSVASLTSHHRFVRRA